MNNEHPKIEELSSFVDGESKRAEFVASHAESCEACRVRLNSMRTLSGLMAELPEPDVHPAFAARVLATISERDSVRGRSGMLRWVYGLAPVAVLGMLIIGVSLNSGVEDSSGSGVGVDSARIDVTALMLEQDEEMLFDQLSAHFASVDSENSIVAAAYQVSTPEPALVDSAVLTFALSDTKNRAQVGQEWSGSRDVRTTIRHLSAGESELFRQMLVVHAQEALLGKASFEG